MPDTAPVPAQLYRLDGEEIHPINPVTQAALTNVESGGNVETVIAALAGQIATAQAAAETAQAAADSAQAAAQTAQTTGETAQTAAASKVSKSGDALTGALSFDHNSCTFINFKNTDANRDNYHQETFWSGLDFSDKNNKPTGGIAHICNDHEVYTNLTCVTSTGVTCAMGLVLPKDGTAYILGYEPPLTDNGRSLASTSWVNKKLGSATSVASVALLAAPNAQASEETLEAKKLKAIAALNAETSQAIYSGLPYEIEGEDYWISYSLFDQQNLADLAIMAAANPEETFAVSVRDENGEERELELSGQAVANLHAHCARLKLNILRAVRAKKKGIMAATSEEGINAIYME